MGELVSHHNDPLAVACPKCSAPAGKRCRTLTTNRSTDTHEARWLAWLNRPRSTETGGTE
jgi:hypothetical protein